MAKKDDDLELDTGGKSSKSKKTIILAVVGVLVIGLATGAGLYFTGIIGGGDASAEQAESADGNTDKVAAEEEPASDTIYHKFDPAFVVNFEDKGKIRFLQVGLTVSTKLPSIIEELTRHEPVIRNSLVLLYSGKTSDELSSPEGKEALRNETREAIQKVMQDNAGKPGIDEVFFTGFVVQ